MRAPVLLPLLLAAASNLMSVPVTPVTAPAGETTVVQVPVRAERWDATSSAHPPASAPLPWHRGFYPGFAKAKREAETLRHPTALPRAIAEKSAAAPSASAALVFEGPEQIDTQAFPPDSQIAAGPDSLIVAVNSLLAIYDKTGKPRGGYQSFNSFFSSLGITGQIFDPRLIFDPVNQRFILSATEIDFARLTNGHILLAVSATSDPTQTWYKFAIDSKGRDASGTRDTFPDFAGLGLSSSAVYITTNQFQITYPCLEGDAESCYFSDAWIRVIALPELLAGNPSLRITTFKNVRTASGFPAFSIQPAVTYGTSASEFMVAAEFSAYTQSTVNLFAIPVAGTPVLTASNLIVPPFNPPPNVVALGTNVPLITDDYRSLNAVWTNGSLWWAHNVASTGSVNALAEWFQIGLPDLTSASLVQSGQVSGAGDAYYPAITAHADGTAALAFTTSNPYLYASAAFTERLPADPRGAMRGYAIYRPGEAAYEIAGDNRWGDYSGISPDPAGDSFWVIAEYAASPNPNYGTAAAQLTAPPSLTLSPQGADFGEVLVGSASPPKSFVLSNTGTSAITLSALSFNGTNAADFALVSDPCSGAPLAPGAACTFTVSFHPSLFGPESAAVTASYGGGSVTAPLTGFGTQQAILSVTPLQLNFPATLQQTASAPQILTLTNSGNIPATLPIAVISGDFTQTNNCPAQLLPAVSCQFQVVFRPTRAGPRSGQLQSPELSIRATLTGTGTAAPAVLLCPNTLTFSNQVTGTASPAQTAILTNTGSETLFISRLTISGDFSETDDCSGGLPPRASCTVTVTFTPTEIGTRPGSLTIASNLATPPQLALTGSGATHSAAAPPALSLPSAVPAQPATTEAARLVADSPLAFESNSGQFPAPVAFLARAEGHSVAITPSGLNIGANLSMTLRGANPLALPAGEEPVPSKSAYLLGADRTQWRTAVPAFAKVKLRGVYPGIDVVYYGQRRRLEYDFIVSPGANPAAIRLLFDGASQLHIDAHGDLIVRTSGGDLRFRKPDIYQQDRHPIHGGYRLLAANEAGFRIGKYNKRQPLVIDPLLAFSTYISGSAKDSFGGLALDPAGNVYITGTTASSDFPVTAAAFQKSCGGTDRHCDPYAATNAVFVSKFSPQGLLLYSTYLGGSGRYQGNAIAVDASGSAYVTGVSFSADFPITDGAFQTKCKGILNSCSNAFVTKLSPEGSTLVYSTFLGGSAGVNTPDQGMAIAVDAAGNALIGGTAGSLDFPTTPGAVQNTAIRLPEGTNAGHGFVTKLNASGTGLIYSTYLGGTGADSIAALVIDASGNAYVAGTTNSLDFPVANAFQSGAYSPTQGFAAKLSPSGALLYATYLGGEGYAVISDLAVDGTGAAYLTGSSVGGFPLTRGGLAADDSAAGGFVTKLDSAGCALSYSTFLPPGIGGGSIAVDNAGNVLMAGLTRLAGSTGPAALGLQPALNSDKTLSISQLDSTGSALLYSTYLGGSRESDPTSTVKIAAGSAGSVYVAGNTHSPDFPSVNAQQAACPSCQGATGVFVAAISPGQPAPVALTRSALFFNPRPVGSTNDPEFQAVGIMNNQSKPLTLSSVTVSGEGFALVDYAPYLGAAPCSASIPANSGCPLWVQFSPRQAGPRSGVLTITGDGPGGPRTVELAGLSLANFQLSYDPPPPVTNGTDSVQIIVHVNPRPYSPSPEGSVALACTGAAVSCRFNPPQVAADSPTPWSTLTVTGLSGFRGNVLPFTVTGTLNGQTDALPVTLSFYGLQLQNVVSAASYLSAYAPESIATAFGSRLATGAQSALASPLPTSLQGTTVTVEGGNHVVRVAPLFFVSPGQVNFQIPPGTFPGLSHVSVTSADGTVSSQYVVITAVAPALFSANASGQGPAAALAFHVKPSGTQTYELLAALGSNGTFIASPIDLGPTGDQVYLSLYGTGLRGRSSLAGVTATVGGIAVPVAFAGLQGQYAGLDQVNVGPLPRSLAGHGLVNIAITVDGTTSNTVQMLVR